MGKTNKTRIGVLRQKKDAGERIVMITAYDAPTARAADEAGVDVLLVGDSLGNVVLGFEDTLPVTLDDMIRHTAAVARTKPRALVVADMPYMTYQVTPEEALRNAGRLMAEGGAEAVKMEGGVPVAQTAKRLVDSGVPVMGHVGLLPQSLHQHSGYRVQGRDEESVERMVRDARALDAAGVFAIVVELATAEAAREITRMVSCPTIGIGAGPHTDGQVLVFHDAVGWTYRETPKFVKKYANLRETLRDAVAEYCRDVREGRYPDASRTHGEKG